MKCLVIKENPIREKLLENLYQFRNNYQDKNLEHFNYLELRHITFY